MAADFQEAASILDLSPRAAAALARRCLQGVLKDHAGATGGTLEKQIESLSSTMPTSITVSMHALRQLGNFAAHPAKDLASGQIVTVEPDEAELTLEILDALFDVVFVRPALLRERLEAVSAKAEAAGKPPLNLDGLP